MKPQRTSCYLKYIFLYLQVYFMVLHHCSSGNEISIVVAMDVLHFLCIFVRFINVPIVLKC